MSDLWKVCARGSAPLRGFNIFLVLYLFYNVFIICRCYFSFVFLCCFLGLRQGLRPIYIYIYGISDASAPRSAPTFFLMRRLHFLCVWSFLNAIMPLYMQAIFFSLSISLIFPLCSPHIFYVLSGHSLDRPAPVIPIVSWLVISFTFPLPPPYTSNIFPKRDLRQVCASHFF